MADIGATNSRCALVDGNGQEIAPKSFKNADFAGPHDVLASYLDDLPSSDRPKRTALAVAAPIVDDTVQMINIGWQFSQRDLQQKFGLQRLIVVNDFAAIAWSLPHFASSDLRQVGTGTAAPRTTLAALGPGSGLGVSALVPTSDGWAAVTGEGGHVSMSAVTDEEQAVIGLLRREFGHCSAERVLSGPGLENLHGALTRLAGVDESNATAADITALARRGEPLASKALGMFFAMLGTVAGDLALTTGARGGVYIAGGIVPRMLDLLERSEFRARFEDKGRYRDYLSAIPTYVITDPLPAFRGLKHLLGYR